MKLINEICILYMESEKKCSWVKISYKIHYCNATIDHFGTFLQKRSQRTVSKVLEYRALAGPY